jgi:hypothetical protein
MEHDEAWQDQQVEAELRNSPWLVAGLGKRLLFGFGMILLFATTLGGLAAAGGDSWFRWALGGVVLGLIFLLPLVLVPRRWLAWNIRQNNPTDETLRRGATAVQRDGIRTDGDVGMKHEPYWPKGPDKR